MGGYHGLSVQVMKRSTIKLIALTVIIMGIGVVALLYSHASAQRADQERKLQIEQIQLKETLDKTNAEKLKLEEQKKLDDQKRQELEQKNKDLEAQLVAKRQAQEAARVALVNRIGPGVSISGGSGSCAAEIAKYDWNQSAAHAVMMKESSGQPGILNNNPSTGDYSVGCFQINILGANAVGRPSESELKDAAVNVAFAYRLWSGPRTFCTSGGWLNTCRSLGLV